VGPERDMRRGKSRPDVLVPPYAPPGLYRCSLKEGGQGEGLRAGLPDEFVCELYKASGQTNLRAHACRA